MAVARDDTEQRNGSLVACEGDANQISTQLRLLPPSSKILVLPPLAQALQAPSDDTEFCARSFIQDVHSAFSGRTETARSFLQSGTSEQPRLVFMNGGSVCARMTCIATISERLTNGEMREAEDIFDEIVKDGVAGLMRSNIESKGEQTRSAGETIVSREGSISGTQIGEGQLVESPSSIAMRAADSLDRKTASLQPYVEDEVEDVDMMGNSHSSTPRAGENALGFSSSKSDTQRDGDQLDTEGVPQTSSESTQTVKQVPGNDIFTEESGDVIKRTILSVPTLQAALTDRRSTFGANPLTPHTARSSSISDAQPYLEYLRELNNDNLLSPSLDNRSAPATPYAVEFGEAYVVDVQSGLDTPTVKQRIRSLDRSDSFYARNPTLLGGRQLKAAVSAQDLRDDAGIMGHKRGSGETSSFEALPRTTFMKASKTTIRKNSTILFRTKFDQDSPTYVDRGTDAVETTPPSEDVEEYVPVFGIIEDLIIHFILGEKNEILDTVIRSYKNGSYPPVPYRELDSPNPSGSDNLQEEPNNTEATGSNYYNVDEVDLYNPDRYQANNGSHWGPRQSSKPVHVVSMGEAMTPVMHIIPMADPPTPAMTPPPTLSEVAQKFQEFSPLNAITALGIQNSLRAILNLHFPPETTNYRQHTFPLEDDRFWKPVFRNDDSRGPEGRTVDQIIAIGCEDGVDKTFFGEICGEVERLGLKDGISRTGKLDIRYLIANAMQNFTSQPLAAQTLVNPFSKPSLLASLVIPQLESYLSLNPSTRLLVLTYPASHLATVLALRRLLGTDLIKVAGIMNSLASDPPFGVRPISRPTTPNPRNLLSNEATSGSRLNAKERYAYRADSINRVREESIASLRRQLSTASNGTRSSSRMGAQGRDTTPSFSRANYLLPSTATDAEIATFLSSIWKTLADKSTFYSANNSSRATTPVPFIAGRSAPVPPTPISPSATTSTPTSPQASAIGGGTRDSGYPKKQSRSGGNMGSKTRSDSVDRERRLANSEALREQERREENDRKWENFYVGGDSESEDELDRILMPRVPVRSSRKGNSRKALKWLGLA